jgi:hypothetical protein
MVGEDTAGWKQRIVLISGGAVIACSSESCGKVVNKTNIQFTTPTRITRDNMTHKDPLRNYTAIFLKGLKKITGNISGNKSASQRRFEQSPY